MKSGHLFIVFFLFLIHSFGYGKDGDKIAVYPVENQSSIYEPLYSESYITNSFASRLFIQKGIYRMKEKAYELAVSDFQQALHLNPGSFEAYSLLGETMVALDLKAEAMKAFDKAIDLNPFYADAYFHRANLFQQTGNYKQAYHDYTIATYIDPLYVQVFEENDSTRLTFKRMLKHELKAARR